MGSGTLRSSSWRVELKIKSTEHERHSRGVPPVIGKNLGPKEQGKLREQERKFQGKWKKISQGCRHHLQMTKNVLVVQQKAMKREPTQSAIKFYSESTKIVKAFRERGR